jgi:hypothetical protein
MNTQSNVVNYFERHRLIKAANARKRRLRRRRNPLDVLGIHDDSANLHGVVYRPRSLQNRDVRSEYAVRNPVRP